jgi:protein phosphatase
MDTIVFDRERILHIDAAALTERGQTRELNEDAVFHQTNQTNTAGLFLVCDGLGGHQAGDVASGITVETVTNELAEMLSLPVSPSHNDHARPSTSTLRQNIQAAITKANVKIRRYAQEHPHVHKLGTTITLTLIYRELALIANVGDSRVYAWRNHELIQLTQDHSLAAKLAEAGMIDEEEVANHPRSNVVLRALGVEDGVDIDFFEWGLQPGDKLLLCSDGLWNAFPDAKELGQWLSSTVAPVDLCQHLVSEANQRDGSDNISAVVIEVKQANP